ncbi:hypothetical protein HY404_02955 [Candidatus Microgenomates bacterium]|nr:hypothetical protein [Candidatus Microgenomates bacterium]
MNWQERIREVEIRRQGEERGRLQQQLVERQRIDTERNAILQRLEVEKLLKGIRDEVWGGAGGC